MINKKTLFVLGAGASIPYGFPSGVELREMLCAPITGKYSQRTVDWIALVSKTGISPGTSNRFAEEFLKSGVTSIDAFLSRRSSAFSEIGKTAIAAILCSFENSAALRRTDNDDDWYGHLWNALVTGVHKCNELANNQVRFVTFNYDRSLEYFLIQSCMSTFDVSYEEAVAAVKPLKVIHVYGQLGGLDQIRSQHSRPYDNLLGASELATAAGGIKIIPESRDDAPEFEEARKLLGWAEKICFLGFGFDPLNVSRLNLESVFKGYRLDGLLIPIVASTYCRTKAENAAIERAMPSTNGWWAMFNQKNLMTIRESGVLL